MGIELFEYNEKNNQYLVALTKNNKVVEYVVCDKHELGKLNCEKWEVGKHYKNFTNALFYLRRG